jgi:hypothetical protein
MNRVDDKSQSYKQYGQAFSLCQWYVFASATSAQDVSYRRVVPLEVAVGFVESDPVLHAVSEAGHGLLGVVQE